MRTKQKILSGASENGVSLNVMPFIDIFSLLCTFLLFSAVFVALGILEVQVPFFSNAPNPEDDKTPERTVTINVHMAKDSLEITRFFSIPPRDEAKDRYAINKQGLAEFHQKLLEIRNQNLKSDLVTLFTEDEVAYGDLVLVLDSIKLLQNGEVISGAQGNDDISNKYSLFPKVVLGSVIL